MTIVDNIGDGQSQRTMPGGTFEAERQRQHDAAELRARERARSGASTWTHSTAPERRRRGYSRTDREARGSARSLLRGRGSGVGHPPGSVTRENNQHSRFRRRPIPRCRCRRRPVDRTRQHPGRTGNPAGLRHRLPRLTHSAADQPSRAADFGHGTQQRDRVRLPGRHRRKTASRSDVSAGPGSVLSRRPGTRLRPRRRRCRTRDARSVRFQPPDPGGGQGRHR